MSGNNVNSALQQFITSLSGRNRSNDEHQFRREANNQLSVSADEPASQGSVQPSLSTPLMPIDDRQMDVDVPQDQVQETTSIAGNGGEEIPATANVSDNDSESESQMDADELEVQLQTTPDLSATTSSSSQPPSSLPSGAATPRGSRRGREHHDDDEDRDRRHPSQRTGPNPSSTAPDATTTPHTAPPPQTDGNHPAHGRSPLLGLTIDWPGGNLRPIPIRMGEGGGGLAALGISLDNLFARMGAAMGNVPEQEDPERAKRLVSALEEVPIGLVRRLERLSKFDDNGMVGDAGCAICWDKLIDESINVGWQSGEKRSSEAKSDDEEQRKIVALPCAHAFHAQCLVPWFSRPRQTTCPTCRFNIDPDNLSATPRRPRRRPSATNARTPPTNPLIPNDDTAVPNPPIIPSTIPTGPPPAEPSQPAIDQQVPGIGDDLPPNERQFFEQLLRRLGGRPSDAPTNPPPATDGQQQQPPPPAPPEGSNAHHVRLSGGPGVVIDVVSMVVGGPSPPGRAAHDTVHMENSNGAPGNLPSTGEGRGIDNLSGHDIFSFNFSFGFPGFGPIPTGQPNSAPAPAPEPAAPAQQDASALPPSNLFADFFAGLTSGLRSQPQTDTPNTAPDPQPTNEGQAPGGPAHAPPPVAHGGLLNEFLASLREGYSGTGRQPAQAQDDASAEFLLNNIFSNVADEMMGAPAPHTAAPGAMDGQPGPSTNTEATDGLGAAQGFGFPFHLPPLNPQTAAGGQVPSNTAAPGLPGLSLPDFTQFLRTSGLPPTGVSAFPMQTFVGAPPPSTRPRMPRERKKWSLPPSPGLSLREKVEKREREGGLRCDDMSCGVAPSDDDPDITVDEKRILIHRSEGGHTCAHKLHPSCLVTSQRIALMGRNVTMNGHDAEVFCPVCRADGLISKSDWDAGVSV